MKPYRRLQFVEASPVLSFARENDQVHLVTDDGDFTLSGREFGGEYGGDLGMLVVAENGAISWLATRAFNQDYSEIGT